MLRREAAPKLRNLARGFPIVAITGPRQSGKTTLARAAFPRHEYLSLEDLDVRLAASEDPRGFLESRSEKGFILDEVQHAPDLLSYLQTFVDGRRRLGRVVLTGSKNLLLLERISQSLAGRVGLLELLPFRLREVAATRPEFGLDDGCSTGRTLRSSIDRSRRWTGTHATCRRTSIETFVACGTSRI